jgi:hypothetical protein
MEAVVEAEVDVAAEVALPVGAVAMVVIEPAPEESGRAVMLRRSAALTTNGGIGKHNGKCSMFANLAGRIPPILLDITTNGSLILSPVPFLPLIFSGLNQERIFLREVVVGLQPPQRLLQQPRLVSSHLVAQ